MAQINLSLPEGLKSWVDEHVAEGRHSSSSDFIRDILRRVQDEEAETAWLRAELDKGMASPIVDKDAHEVLKDIMDGNRARNADHRSAA